MKQIKTFAILSALMIALAIPTPAQAVGIYDKYTEWYSDASGTELVGWRWQHCDGSMEADGYVTKDSHVWLNEACAGGDGTGTITNVCQYQPTKYGYLCPAY